MIFIAGKEVVTYLSGVGKMDFYNEYAYAMHISKFKKPPDIVLVVQLKFHR